METGKKTQKRKTGDLGEEIACRFLAKHEFEILERNYSKKWGELDIIAKKGDKIHFVEVKTVSRETSQNNISHETHRKPITANIARALANTREMDTYRAEDNVHPWKLKRLSRAIQTYLLDRRVSPETDFQLDIITVCLNDETRKARVEVIENVIIE